MCLNLSFVYFSFCLTYCLLCFFNRLHSNVFQCEVLRHEFYCTAAHFHSNLRLMRSDTVLLHFSTISISVFLGGQEVIKIGDTVIGYNNNFRFFMTTKLSNPHYSPEIQVKVSLLNFTITTQGKAVLVERLNVYYCKAYVTTNKIE